MSSGFALVATTLYVGQFWIQASVLGHSGETRILTETRRVAPDGRAMAVLRYESSGGATGTFYYALYVARADSSSEEILAAVVLRASGPDEPSASRIEWRGNRQIVLFTTGDVRKYMPHINLGFRVVEVKIAQ